MHDCPVCGSHPVDLSPAAERVPGAVELWSAYIAEWNELPRGGHVLAFSLPMHMDSGPAGRPFIDVQVTKASKAQEPPFRYSLHLSRSVWTPEKMPDIPSASVTMRNTGRLPPSPPTMHSVDMLGSERLFLSKRPPSSRAGTTRAGPGSNFPAGEVRLTVRAAQRPVELSERINFVSNYELAATGELIERRPGRMVMFLVGIEPLPAGGTFKL